MVALTMDFVVYGIGLWLCIIHVEVVPQCWLMEKLFKAVCVCYSPVTVPCLVWHVLLTTKLLTDLFLPCGR